MFNVPDGRATTLYIRAFHRRQAPLERVFAKGVKRIYKKQFALAAKTVEQGIDRDAEDAIGETLGELREVFKFNYRRIAQVFSDWTLDEFAKHEGLKSIKAPKDDFWIAFDNFVEVETAIKIVIVAESQRKLIRDIIRKGTKEGLSHKLIAKDIMAKSEVVSRYKAVRIARTEVHNVSNYAVQSQIKATGRRATKEWSHSNDERVRTKKFNHKVNEIVNVNEPFVETGEEMDHPGSSMGSAGNVCNCRCVAKYHIR